MYELNEGRHHDQMVSLRCGRVEEFYDADIERRQNEVAKRQGFELQDHAPALYSLCGKHGCRKGR